MDLGRPVRFTATADIDASGVSIIVKGFTVSPGSTLTTVTLREKGSAGTIVWQGIFAANASPVAFPQIFTIEKPHVTIAGTAAEATFFL